MCCAMFWSSKVLGSTTATQLQERAALPVLQIGSDKFTKGQLAKIECFSYIAAANLSRKLEQLDVKHTKDLFDRVPPAMLAISGLGAVSLAVLGAAFEAKGIGGSRAIEAWMEKHQDGELKTFGTVKNIVKRDAEDQRKEERTVQKRKARRKQTAHEIRVERHVKRASDAA